MSKTPKYHVRIFSIENFQALVLYGEYFGSYFLTGQITSHPPIMYVCGIITFPMFEDIFISSACSLNDKVPWKMWDSLLKEMQ